MNRLIVVSNRLPFALDSTGEDLWTVTPAAGGLVSAVEPVLRERGGTWIGWPGIAGKIPKGPFADATRRAGIARAGLTRSLDVFSAYPLPAVRHFCKTASTAAATTCSPAIRSAWVPDTARPSQFSRVRAARDVGRTARSSSRTAISPFRKARHSPRAFPDWDRLRLV